MRSLKFRAWDARNKLMIPEILTISKNGGIDLLYQLVPPDLIIMQFTGLHDKNGKEIWEGDILECIYGYVDKQFEVYFENGLFSMKTKDGLTQPVYVLGQISKVLGNIYEHPHLLETHNA